MCGSEYSKINFRITLDSEGILDVNQEGQPALLASSLLGQIRWGFKNLFDSDAATEEEVFGSSIRQGKIISLEMTFHGEPNNRMFVSIDRFTGSAKEVSLFKEITVPAGATIIGAILVSNTLSQRYITLVRSAILGIEQSGVGKESRLGYGQCHIAFIDLKDIGRVFVSYTWEDKTHNEWVLSPADRLTRDGISVIFDRYDLKVGDNMHVFMEESVQQAKKVLLILTPLFKEKADRRKGGAGYEFSMISSELFDSLADNNKFLPVIRRGSYKLSTLAILRSFLACDMSDDHVFEQKYSELYSAILCNSSVERPTCSI